MRTVEIVVITFAIIILGSLANAANSGVTYQGRILRPDGSPLSGATTQFKLQVRTPDANNCLMYEEIQALDMRNSGGQFSLTMNDGTGARTDTTGLNLDRIFANRGTFTFDPTTCSTGSSYSANTGDGRMFVVLFKDETMTTWEPIPPAKINFVPFAFESKQIAGFSADSLLRVVNGSGDPLTGLAPLSNAQYTELMALVNGTSTAFTKSGQLGGTALPTMNSGEVLGWNGSAWVSTTSTPGAASVTTAMLQNNAVDATKIANGAIGTTQVASNVTINTSGTVGAAITTTRDFKIYAASPSVFNIDMQAPALAASYSLVWPLDDGNTGDVLTSNGSGVLSWAPAAASSQWTTQAPGINYMAGNVGIGTTSPTASLDVVGSSRIASSNANAQTVQTFTLLGSGKPEAVVATTGIANNIYPETRYEHYLNGQASGWPTVTLQTGAGTASSPSALGAGKSVGEIKFQSHIGGGGFTGTASPDAKAIAVIQGLTDTAADNGKLVFRTASSASTYPSTYMTISSQGLLGIGGNTSPAAKLHLVGSASSGAWSSNGIAFRQGVGTYTDTTSAGTVAKNYVSTFQTPTLAASSATTYTDAASVAISPPIIGTNVSITNSSALRIPSAAQTGVTTANGLFVDAPTGAANNYAAIFNGGNVGIGTTAPTARLNLPAGTAAASTAPLKFTSGTLMTTPEDGAMEYNSGTGLWFTIGTTRFVIPTNTAAGNFSNVSNISNAGGSITMTPSAGNSVLINQSTTSTNSTSGALVVTGGVGIGGALNTAGNIVSGGSITATTNGVIPQLYGSTSPAGNIRIDGTSDASVGNVYLASAGGKVGIGTTAPQSTFHISAVTSPEIRLTNNTTGHGFFDGGLLQLSGSDISLVNYEVGGRVGFGVNGTAMTVAYGGNVGIGTTSPSAPLEVVGAVQLQNATGINTRNSGGTSTNLISMASYNDVTVGGLGNASVTIGAAGVYGFRYTPTISYMTSGSVGIGTTSPISSLHVSSPGATTVYVDAYGTGNVGQLSGRAARGTLATPTASQANDALFFSGGRGYGATGFASLGSSAGIMVRAAENFTDTAQGGYLGFETTPIGSVPTSRVERMRISSAGDVGIGTTLPATKLDVVGSIRSVGTGGVSTANSTTTIDWSKGNNQSMSTSCAGTTFTNMADGATYNLAVTETSATTCTFAQAGLTFLFTPANGNRVLGQQSLYSFTRIGAYVYTAWATMQ